MLSKLLTIGAYLVAFVSVLIGGCCYTSIPKKLGLYRVLTRLDPMLIGFTPAFHHGIPWGYTWEEFYSQVDWTGQNAIVTGTYVWDLV